MDEIVTAQDRKFIIKHRILIRENWDQEKLAECLKGMIYLRKPNENILYLVEEIPDAKFVDIQDDYKPIEVVI